MRADGNPDDADDREEGGASAPDDWEEVAAGRAGDWEEVRPGAAGGREETGPGHTDGRQEAAPDDTDDWEETGAGRTGNREDPARTAAPPPGDWEDVGPVATPRPDDDWEDVGPVAAPSPPTRTASPPPPPPPVLGGPCARCTAVVPAGLARCPRCLAPVAARGRGSGAGRTPARIARGALRLVFWGGAGHLDVPRGAEINLGRSTGWAPEAADFLADEPSVSARHATVAHTPDGVAWLTEVPQGATNGTRVNDTVLRPGSRFRLHNGDRVGLGPRVDLIVQGVAEEPRGATG